MPSTPCPRSSSAPPETCLLHTLDPGSHYPPMRTRSPVPALSPCSAPSCTPAQGLAFEACPTQPSPNSLLQAAPSLAGFLPRPPACALHRSVGQPCVSLLGVRSNLLLQRGKPNILTSGPVGAARAPCPSGLTGLDPLPLGTARCCQVQGPPHPVPFVRASSFHVTRSCVCFGTSPKSHLLREALQDYSSKASPSAPPGPSPAFAFFPAPRPLLFFICPLSSAFLTQPPLSLPWEPRA